ncbi:MAG: MarR family transcriptional regulator [archaeon]
MKNKIVGALIIVIAFLIGLIVYTFNRALTKIVGTSCTHGPSCPMWGTINAQTKIGLIIMIFVMLIGLYLVFFGKEEKIITKIKTVRQTEHNEQKRDYSKIINTLDKEEKLVLEKVIESEGTIFQSDLVEKTEFPKVKVTRILDRLEGKNLIERKRRGMTNIVILKHQNNH